MVAENRIEGHLLGIHLFEFTDPLRIINAGDAMLNEVISQHQHQIAAQFVTGTSTSSGHILLMLITGTSISE